MLRSKKHEAVDRMREAFQASELVIVTHHSGLTVAEATTLRRTMRDAGARFRVTKNTLAKIALRDTPHEFLADLFTGPTAAITGEDPVQAAKAVSEYAKKSEKLKIIGAAFSGAPLAPDGVEALATMPSIEELRGKIVGLLQAPAVKLVGILPQPATQLVRLVPAPHEKLARVIAAQGAKEAA